MLILILGLLLFCAYKTVTSQTVWKRSISLTACGIVIAYLCWISVPLIRYGFAIKCNDEIIRPTGELWTIAATNLATGNIDQAKSDISYITLKWNRINTYSYKYTAKDLLRDIQNNNQANKRLQSTTHKLSQSNGFPSLQSLLLQPWVVPEP